MPAGSSLYMVVLSTVVFMLTAQLMTVGGFSEVSIGLGGSFTSCREEPPTSLWEHWGFRLARVNTHTATHEWLLVLWKMSKGGGCGAWGPTSGCADCPRVS